MTREEAIKRIREASKFDTEAAHAHGDKVLCDLLTALGFEDVVAEWNRLDKWYA